MDLEGKRVLITGGSSGIGLAIARALISSGAHVVITAPDPEKLAQAALYPGTTDTPMMQSSKAGPELGFMLEPADAVANALIEGIRENAFEVIRGGEARAKMIAANRDNPASIDERFLSMEPALEEAVSGHSAL